MDEEENENLSDEYYIEKLEEQEEQYKKNQ